MALQVARSRLQIEKTHRNPAGYFTVLLSLLVLRHASLGQLRTVASSFVVISMLS